MAQEELTKVHVDLPHNAEAGGEAMWAKPLGDDLYELRNNPFYAHGLNSRRRSRALWQMRGIRLLRLMHGR